MGSMIGSGIFIVSADMARVLGNPLLLLCAWLFTGFITIIAALCFSELAAMFPKSGGQYQFLKEAYNPLVAFLFGWSVFFVIQSGAIAAVAVAFAKFTSILFPFFGENHILFQISGLSISAAQVLAIVSLLVLTWVNSQGLEYGGFIQRLLTSIKALSLLFLIVCGILIFRNPEAVAMNFKHFFSLSKFTLENGVLSEYQWTWAALLSAVGVSLVGSVFSSDAWNNVTYIASEIENPRKNVPRSLILGVAGVTILYTLANVSYLCLLPLWGQNGSEEVLQKGIQYAQNDRVGTAAMNVMFGNAGYVIMAILIMISTFGCNNGLILSGARVYQTMAQDGLFFKKMALQNKFSVPGFSLWVQCIWCSILCLSGKYNELLDYVVFVVVIFYILTIIGLILLRKNRPDLERPIKTFGYPFLPLIYIILMSIFTVNLIMQKPTNTIWGLVIVLAGIPIYYFWRSLDSSSGAEPDKR